MKATGKIYTLRVPCTDNIIYVGCTSKTLQERLKGHQYRLINGVETVIELVEETPAELAADAEYFWIQQFKCWGFELLNKEIKKKAISPFVMKHINNGKYKIERRINCVTLHREYGIKPSEVYALVQKGEVKRFKMSQNMPSVYCLNELKTYFSNI